MLARRQYQHIALNIAAMVLPMVAGVLVVPDLIQRLGTDRFGVLSLAWVLVGYFGLLDLGLARGLTQYLAQQQSLGTPASERAQAARQVRRWMIGLGLVWALLLLAVTPWVTGPGLRLPKALQAETSIAWVFLALSAPPLLWAASSTGVLEAHQRFTALNAVRLPLGVAAFAIPWALAHWRADLATVLGGLLGLRVVAALALALLSRRHFAGASDHAIDLRQILRFGGWLSVSNFVGPLLSYFDRFAVAALVSVSAVTYYTVPFDVLIRLPTVPMAMMAALFPLLAQSHLAEPAQEGQLLRMFEAVTQLLVSFWLPGMLVCGLVGTLTLDWWIGPEMARLGGPVWAWLALGILLNGFAHLPYALLHSAGRSNTTARFHLAELLPYLALVWWALQQHGIVGAAVVWTLRCAVDTALLYFAVARLRPGLRAACWRAVAWAFGALFALAAIQLVAHGLPAPWPTRVDVWGLVAAALAWSAWHGRKLRASGVVATLER